MSANDSTKWMLTSQHYHRCCHERVKAVEVAADALLETTRLKERDQSAVEILDGAWLLYAGWKSVKDRIPEVTVDDIVRDLAGKIGEALAKLKETP